MNNDEGAGIKKCVLNMLKPKCVITKQMCCFIWNKNKYLLTNLTLLNDGLNLPFLANHTVHGV